RAGADARMDQARAGLSGLGQPGGPAQADGGKRRGMTGFKAILFDCDGVLLDSEPLGCASIAQAMTAAGVAMTTDEAAALFCGHSAAASLAVIAGAGLDPHAVADHADRILFSMFEQEVPLMAGV